RGTLGDDGEARFDLKHGAGGLVDLEFMLQAQVLVHATHHPLLLRPRDSTGLLAACVEAGLVEAEAGRSLADAHAVLLGAALECSLDRRSRVLPPIPWIQQARKAVLRLAVAVRPQPPPAPSPAAE